ncbi:hypothetical protein CEW87_05565 [Parazoarcus communis]|uniref:Uncharacterized protein n=1 Tax=Parazoarcus communis TaxID=41977 RepID=A0A2U8GZ14_9RHOO|nr:hypothetical protein [Parazoarcus communis]AWI78871.1 hypothetical protein CEW87_05565 [Parazoarcus communis]
MSDLSDGAVETAEPSPAELVRYAGWFQRFIDPDRNADYRGVPWDVFRGLLIQHSADWKDGTPANPVATKELWSSVVEGRGESAAAVDGSKARKRLNDHWSELETMFRELVGRFSAGAVKEGFDGLLWPVKDRSPGGRSATYRLEWRPVGATVEQPTLPATYSELPFVLRYHEDKSSLRFSWLGRLFFLPLFFRRQSERAVRVDGRRRYVPALALGMLALMTGLLLLLALATTTSSGLNWTLMLMSAVFYWVLLHPLARLYDRKVIMASPLFYPFKERDCQVELTWDDDAAENNRTYGYNLRLVRYAAECPLCGAKVWVNDGKLEFFDRLVGRCTDEPGEHVFSFDHQLLSGYWLRAPRR